MASPLCKARDTLLPGTSHSHAGHPWSRLSSTSELPHPHRGQRTCQKGLGGMHTGEPAPPPTPSAHDPGGGASAPSAKDNGSDMRDGSARRTGGWKCDPRKALHLRVEVRGP